MIYSVVGSTWGWPQEVEVDICSHTLMGMVPQNKILVNRKFLNEKDPDYISSFNYTQGCNLTFVPTRLPGG